MAGSNNANLDCKVVADTGHILGVEMMDTLLAAKKNAACNLVLCQDLAQVKMRYSSN